jgi:hypothetical protein
MTFGLGWNLYYRQTLPTIPVGTRSHIIDLGKGPPAFGTESELRYCQISDWVIKGSIFAAFLTVGLGMRLKNDGNSKNSGGG